MTDEAMEHPTRRPKFRETDGMFRKLYGVAARLQPVVALLILLCGGLAWLGIRWEYAPWTINDRVTTEKLTTAARFESTDRRLQFLEDRFTVVIERLDVLADIQCAKLTPAELAIARRKLTCSQEQAP